jgi:antitoxin ParD1/3/4
LEERAKRQALLVVELIDAIQAGIVSGTGVPAEEVFDRLEKKYASMVHSENG